MRGGPLAASRDTNNDTLSVLRLRVVRLLEGRGALLWVELPLTGPAAILDQDQRRCKSTHLDRRRRAGV